MLQRGTLVLMHSGTVKRVEDVHIDDFLMGPDSTPRRVRETSPGEGPLYRITPIHGAPWFCNDEHVFTIAGTSFRKGQILDVSVKEFLTWTPRQRLYWRLWRTGVEFSATIHPVDPYLIGLWLGDGSTDRPEITSMDPEVIGYCKEIAPRYSLRCVVVDTPSKAKVIRLAGPHGGDLSTRKNLVHDVVRTCVQNGSKFIPQHYLIASRDQRLSLLAGILDTDGCLVDCGFVVSTTLNALRDDVLFLARSLGFGAYAHTCKSSIKATGFVGAYHRIHISGDLTTVPTRIARKRAVMPRYPKRVDVPGFVLDLDGQGTFNGFTLEGDGRFVLGDFTITHDSSSPVPLDTALLLSMQKRRAIGLRRGIYDAAKKEAVRRGQSVSAFVESILTDVGNE